MARWKLACAHYLNTVKPAKWRYSHQDRATGENIEKEFIVPRMLDPNDPKCWTNKFGVGIPVSRGGSDADAEGEVIVCLPGKGLPGDIEFLGDPGPDMIPQDEEADQISATFQDRWAYKADIPEITYSQAVVDRAQVQSAEPVKVEGLAELVQMLAAQQAQTQAMLEALAHKDKRV